MLDKLTSSCIVVSCIRVELVRGLILKSRESIVEAVPVGVGIRFEVVVSTCVFKLLVSSNC